MLVETVAKINLIHASFSVNSVSSSFLGQPVRKQICGCISFEDFLSKYTGDDSALYRMLKSEAQISQYRFAVASSTRLGTAHFCCHSS
jgi:hypothetical protein